VPDAVLLQQMESSGNSKNATALRSFNNADEALMFRKPGEGTPHVPTAWHAVGVVKFAQTSIGSERIMPMQGRHGKYSTDSTLPKHDVRAQT
jgi:hypothetical protein